MIRVRGDALVSLAACVAALIALGCGRPAVSSSAPAEVALPAAATVGKMSVEEAISKRRSVRRFADKDLTIGQVGQLAWAAQGITEPGRGLRAAPSAGATYPLEMYVVKKEGVFHYLPQGHKLEQLSDRDHRADLAQAAMGQGSVRGAPVSFVFAAVYQRTRARYGDRAERYVHMEAGHAAENIHLQAVALGLGSVPVGAFDDGEVAKALSLPADQAPIYIIPVGYPGGA
jgi:SagB-type dehydrogenase family enzyme